MKTLLLHLTFIFYFYSFFFHDLSAEKQIFIHYMPWYEAKPFSENWGYHWTMDHFNPDETDPETGFKKIASHDYPLLEPYDSNDPDVLECHLQWIKLAGIDGIIIDWYGIENHFDYALVHRNTQHLIEVVKKARLKFSICYEDQTYLHTLKTGLIKEEEVMTLASKCMTWMDSNWFKDPSYFKLQDCPVLLVFGPQYFKPSQWTKLWEPLETKPKLFGLPHLSQSGSHGSFLWPPVHGGIEIEEQSWKNYLKEFYKKSKEGEDIIAVAFPGYRDIYAEAQKGESYGFIDARNNSTLKDSLEMAFESSANLIQIATWNDYGEGTVIEPTQQHRYDYLEIVQEKCLLEKESNSYNKNDLKLPLQIYHLKQRFKNDVSKMKSLQQLSLLLLQGRTNEVRVSLKNYPEL